MIFVVDNGQDYSEQSIWFIEVQPEQRDRAEDLFKRISERASGGHEGLFVVGVFDVIEWRDPTAVTTLDAWEGDARSWRFREVFEKENVSHG